MMYKIIFILVIMALLINCSEKDPIDPDPPNRVIMVIKEPGFDTLQVERGIDAEPNPNSSVSAIELNWYEPTDKYKVSYFNIYRSEDEAGKLSYKWIGNTENQINIPDTVFIDTTLSDTNGDFPYWYYVTAVDEDGTESEPSDTVKYTLIEKATELSIIPPDVLRDSTITFKWMLSNEDIVNNYYLRVEQLAPQPVFQPFVYFKVLNSNYQVTETFQVSIENFRFPIINGGVYRWRIDCVGTDIYSGSESDWAEFTVSLE